MSLSQYAAHFAASARRNLTEGDGRCAGSTLPVRCEGCDGRRTDVLVNRPRYFLGIRFGWRNDAYCTTCYWATIPTDLHYLTQVWWLPEDHPATWGALLESLPDRDDDIVCELCEGVCGPVEYVVYPPEFPPAVNRPETAGLLASFVCARDFDLSVAATAWTPGSSAAYVGRQYTSDAALNASDAVYDSRVALHFVRDGK